MSALDTTWPDFLDILDGNPGKATDTFYVFVSKMLKVCPPRVLHSLSDDDQQDLTHDVVVHCIRNDFRVLREYRDQGRPFAAWLYFVIRNKALDLLRRAGREPRTVGTEVFEASPESRDSGPVATQSAPKTLIQKEILAVVGRCLAKLDENCRLLIRLAAEEYAPREIARVLRWPAEKAKKISDDLRYCRQKLRKLIGEHGVDLESVL